MEDVGQVADFVLGIFRSSARPTTHQPLCFVHKHNKPFHPAVSITVASERGDDFVQSEQGRSRRLIGMGGSRNSAPQEMMMMPLFAACQGESYSRTASDCKDCQLRGGTRWFRNSATFPLS